MRWLGDAIVGMLTVAIGCLPPWVWLVAGSQPRLARNACFCYLELISDESCVPPAIAKPKIVFRAGECVCGAWRSKDCICGGMKDPRS